MLGELRGTLREQHGQALGPVHERNEHRRGHRVGGKMPLQPAAAIGVDSEQALREAERRYRSLFDNAIEGIFRTTPDGSYLDAHPALASIYGFATSQ